MIAGLAVFAFYLYYVVGFDAFLGEIETINLYYYMLAFVAALLSVLCFSLAWNNLLSGLQIRVSAWRTFIFSWVGMFIDEVVPGGISGDFFKAYLISKDSELETGKVVASVVVQKLFTVAILVVNLIAGLTLLSLNYGFQLEFLILTVVSIGLLVALFIAFIYFSVKPKATERVVGWAARLVSLVRRKGWDKAHFQESARKTLGPFHDGFQSLRGNKRALVKAAVFSSLVCVFDISLILIVFASLKYPVPMDKALIVYALSVGLGATGATIIGFTEVIMSTLYASLGIPFRLSFLATLLIRFASLWFKLSIAFVSFQCVVVNRCVCSACDRVSLRRNQTAAKDEAQEMNPQVTS